jgi:glycosyltransferase involved in cell wall biosynthesis
MSARIAVVLKGYPRLSETFIAQELLALERAGFALHIFSMRRPTDRTSHPITRQIAAPVTYLPEYLYQEPRRVIRGLWRARRSSGFRRALGVWMRDFWRDPTPNRVRRFGQAAVLASELPADITWLYAHFIHTPSAVTRYASLMTGLDWSCSAHAKDIWTSRDWELAANLASARWAVTCTAAGHSKLRQLADDPGKVDLVYHGLDLERFGTFSRDDEQRDGRNATAPVRLLAVGRAVEKKGFDVLLEALARLPGEFHWRLTHIGGGEQKDALKAQAARLGLADRIDWRGAQDQPSVLSAYRAADLFVLPCRIARNGDRDGLPNVLIEAQSQQLACLSTTVSGVPELITNGETGVLVAPDDVDALTAGLIRLIADPALRQRLGQAGARRVREQFDATAEIHQLVHRLNQSLEAPNTRALPRAAE